MKKAFISGPIQGMEDEQEYRKIISKICGQLGFEVIDPWNREKIIYNHEEPCWWNKVPASEFVQRDLEDADACDLMIVYLPKLSAGACMELFYAKRKGKKIVVVSDMPCLSPWIVVHSDNIVKDFNELETELKKMQTKQALAESTQHWLFLFQKRKEWDSLHKEATLQYYPQKLLLQFLIERL